MECPNCHKEVPPGYFFCPHCLEEIPWVPEFNTVEQQLLRKNLDAKAQEEEKAEEPKPASKLNKKKKSLRRAARWFLRRVAPVLLAGAAILGAVLYSREQHSFSHLYRSAESAFQYQNYYRALDYLTAAIDLEPDHYEVNLLLVKTQQALGDHEAVRLLLKPMLTEFPEHKELYRMMAETLYKLGDISSLHELFREVTDPEILSDCQEYLCPPPPVNAPGGTYGKEIWVGFSGEYKAVYYTLDGSDPTEASTLYDGPILMTSGTTVLKAIGVNQLGIVSEIQEQKYVVSVGQPDPPVITPASGIYNEQTLITLEVPEGYRAYYAFDEVPTTASTLYERPISMPLDYHTFYAILVSAEGKVSEPAQAEYRLEY